jgi:hypothetical protein
LANSVGCARDAVSLAANGSQRPGAKRDVDPLLFLRSDRQLVATGGNGFGLLEPISGLVHLPPVATGCDR